MSLYKIKRHSGDNKHIWRTILITNNYKEACDKFISISKNLKQGTLILYEDEIAIFETSPRLKNKWFEKKL